MLISGRAYDQFQNKLHSSADQNTFSIYSLYFKLQNVVEKSNLLQYKLEGIISGGTYNRMYFFVYRWMGV